jgi:5'-nucleotidase
VLITRGRLITYPRGWVKVGRQLLRSSIDDVALLILLSNDDGIDAPGLAALERAFAPLGDVVVVAPAEEQSAKSHSLTMFEPLRVSRRGERRYAVTGTPADCAYIGVHHLCGRPPDLVVSGVNRGVNLGDDVHYSGTVAAAMEGALIGVPAVAVSLAAAPGKRDDARPWDLAAGLALRVARALLDDPLDGHAFLNLNVPDVPELQGLKVARQGKHWYHPLVEQKEDPRGRPYFWLGGDHRAYCDEPDTDGHWFARGYATLTPMRPDLTAHRLLERVGRWGL